MTASPDQFDVRLVKGLSDREVLDRIERHGYNELPSSKPRSLLAIALEVVREPMFLLLIGSGGIYLVLGDLQEALFLLAFVFFVIGITLYQQRKTERALEALRDLSSPRALVIRDGERRRISGREVVTDDILMLAEGDRVPADAVVLDCVNLSTDESLLTGESVPVRKAPWDGSTPFGRPGGDDLPFVYSGTLVVSGQGVARVRATGVGTELGKIGKALRSVETEDTRLQQETERLVKSLAVFGLTLCALVVVIYGLSRGSWLHGVLAGITTAMALLPEEFPVVLTIFLALGAWRLSRGHVLTRHMPAVETLGSATVLAVDKTGTLTLNRMTIAKLFANGREYDVGHQSGALPEAFHEVVEFGILASQTNPFDPMEKAFRQLGHRDLADTEHLHEDWTLVREYPLSGGLLAMSRVWKSIDGDDYVIAAKGAPEAIADLCHLGGEVASQMSARVAMMADEGLRVLGVARARLHQPVLPGGQHDFRFEFLGLVGLADPVRPTVPAAIRECYRAGIRVVMITGDYAGTARTVGQQIGLAPGGECITGPELDAMDDVELRRRIGAVTIFARVVPEQKLRLVEALKANGEVVAMTGDGVNDAPALKAAHIGIAMGGRGSDVAREASALVLLDDDFSSIVQAVRLGRRIFDNLKKAMTYIFAIHVPIAGLSLVPVALGWPLVLLPVHIVFLELIIDPACSIIFEAEPDEVDVMQRPPRNSEEPLFGRRMIGVGLAQGFSVLVIVLAVFGVALRFGWAESEARALTFTTLVVANLGLIFANRSWSRLILATLRSRNPAVWWVSGLALGVLALVLYVPFLQSLFRFMPLGLGELTMCGAAGIVSVFWFEILKAFNRRRRRAVLISEP
jgi:Ca2+-transporting ATPase